MTTPIPEEVARWLAALEPAMPVVGGGPASDTAVGEIRDTAGGLNERTLRQIVPTLARELLQAREALRVTLDVMVGCCGYESHTEEQAAARACLP